MSLHLSGRLAPLVLILICACFLETVATKAGEPSSSDAPSESDLKESIRQYYDRHWVKPLRILGAAGTVEMRALQQIKRYEIRNTYIRAIEGEQFRYYDVAVETNSGAGLGVELLPLRFVKRGNSWYSSLDAEREVQTLPPGSLSSNAKLYGGVVTKKESPDGTPKSASAPSPRPSSPDAVPATAPNPLRSREDDLEDAVTSEVQRRQAAGEQINDGVRDEIRKKMRASFDLADRLQETKKSHADSDGVTWQQSVTPIVELSIRDKYATLGKYEAVFIVDAPNGQRFTTGKIQVQADMTAYVVFPNDFKPYSKGMDSGKYRWSGQVMGCEVTRGEFEEPSMTSQWESPHR